MVERPVGQPVAMFGRHPVDAAIHWLLGVILRRRASLQHRSRLLGRPFGLDQIVFLIVVGAVVLVANVAVLIRGASDMTIFLFSIALIVWVFVGFVGYPLLILAEFLYDVVNTRYEVYENGLRIVSDGLTENEVFYTFDEIDTLLVARVRFQSFLGSGDVTIRGDGPGREVLRFVYSPTAFRDTMMSRHKEHD